jgi:L-threonylcarbamoyladenylate synthase
MKRIKINPTHPEAEKIQMARNILRRGGVVVYPTDTLYGLGANIFREEAVKRVYRIKRRSQDKPLSICLGRVEDLERVAYLEGDALKLAKNLLPGPYTLILKKKDHIPDSLSAGSDKIGVRIPDSPVCRELALEFPITTTSANLSGEEPPIRVDQLVELFQEEVDLYLDGGDGNRSPSTVIDLSSWPLEILRAGAGVEDLQSLEVPELGMKRRF